MRRSPQRQQRGFSLIEMTMVIVVVSVAAVPLLGSLAQPGRALLLAEDLQVATNVAQACADFIVRSHHDGVTSYANITTTTCNSLPVTSGYPPVVTVTDVTSATISACPSASIGFCKKLIVTVTKSSTKLSELTFMVTNY